ncbi:phosphoethanolamine transferase [Helicobacter pametensis]|uniref:phosphoethanolamine transferase n=1 Tax=Helicobacter pametensis TaxID=95149 RepID=UPI000686999D|nr:phosphoethanolamine transferase [Helicobacter pametensis]
MLKISYHWHICFVAALLTCFANSYFFALISPSLSWGELVLVGVLLFSLLALALEILCMRWTYKLVLPLILLLAAGFSYSINSLRTGVTPDLIYSILTANPREMQETINLSMILNLLLLCLVPSIFVWRIKSGQASWLRGCLLKFGILMGYTALVLVLWFGAIGKDLTFLFKKDRTLYYVVNPISPIRSFVQFLGDQGRKHLSYTQVGLDARLESSSRPKFIVFVIGESARGMNFSLNGYKQNTNPLLAKEASLVSFRHFSSCGVITAISVPCMLTDYTHKTYTKRYLSDFRDNILDITQRVGIQTYYIGNNGGGCIGNICVRLPKEHVKFYNDGNLDGVMLEDLSAIAKTAKGDTFVILHQMGSHGQSYYKRYPKEFARFTPTCNSAQIQDCSHESLINTYDNTILYTDFFLKESIQRLKQLQNRFDVMLWYVSDHGESLGESGMYMHGGLPYFLAPKTQTQVPSIVWFGRGFEWAYKMMKPREDEELSQDYVFHTLLGLFGIKTKARDSSLDLTH